MSPVTHSDDTSYTSLGHLILILRTFLVQDTGRISLNILRTREEIGAFTCCCCSGFSLGESWWHWSIFRQKTLNLTEFSMCTFCTYCCFELNCWILHISGVGEMHMLCLATQSLHSMTFDFHHQNRATYRHHRFCATSRARDDVSLALIC